MTVEVLSIFHCGVVRPSLCTSVEEGWRDTVSDGTSVTLVRPHTNSTVSCPKPSPTQYDDPPTVSARRVGTVSDGENTLSCLPVLRFRYDSVRQYRRPQSNRDAPLSRRGSSTDLRPWYLRLFPRYLHLSNPTLRIVPPETRTVTKTPRTQTSKRPDGTSVGPSTLFGFEQPQRPTLLTVTPDPPFHHPRPRLVL